MEELTPRILASLLLLVLGLAPVVTMGLSALLLGRYRRAVTRRMMAAGGFDGAEEPAPPAVGPGKVPVDGTALRLRASRGPWTVALDHAAAGLALALLFAAAAKLVYPYRLGLPGFLVGVWIYLWPVVPATLLIVPAARLRKATCAAAYIAVFVALTLWVGTVEDIPGGQYGSIELPGRSSATPLAVGRLWLVADGPPTLLVLLCFNRWARAVAPLVLGWVTTALSGSLVVYLAIFTPRGIDLFVAVATRLEWHPGWLVAASVVLSLALFGAVGWGLARWVGRAYLRRAVSDQSLTLDALWLVFAVYYAMWLVLGGLRWSATAAAGFGAYKLVLALARRLRRARPGESRGLTFLRVFALGRRSERLLEAVAGSWRHVGSVQMITGPDVAKSTVQPHQFLDFLSRRLGDHFVRDAASLERAVAGCDREPGLHGRYQVNSFFCHADSWRPTLLRLVRPGDAVLMDLRSFSADNAGCIHELRHLVGHVPLDRCLLVVDATTDTSFLDRTLHEVWEDLPPQSPNCHRSPDDTPRHVFARDTDAVAEIVRRLCLGPAAAAL